MRPILPALFLATILVAPDFAMAHGALGDPVDIVDMAARQRGDRSPVLVLGTSHLSSLPEDFDRGRMDPLLDRLAGWKPDAIAIESLPGWQCDFLHEYDFQYPGTWSDYCLDPAPARLSTGLTGAEATKAAEELLGQPSTTRSSSERRRLAALFLAAGNPASALVQWFRLPADERHADSVLTKPLVEILESRARSRNENYMLAAELAARLGHDQVYPVDDHSGDRAAGNGDDALFESELTLAWSNPSAAARREELESWDRRVAQGAPIMGWYQAINRREALDLAMQGDFGAAAGAKGPGNGGRRYLAYWETRNLRMVANVREVIGQGRRVLAIVGVSHKPYYERYLGMTSDIEIVPLSEVLGD
jgi:hypothetical protein